MSGGTSVDMPNELWLHVFGFATFVPGVLDIASEDPFQASLPYGLSRPMYSDTQLDSVRRDVRTSIAFGLQLTLVSKRWHDIFIARLYRHLHIRSHRHLDALIHKLARPQELKSHPFSSPWPLGSLVRRLDLAITDVPWRHGGSVNFLSQVERLFEHLPQLKILEISWSVENPVSSRQSLQAGRKIQPTLDFWETVSSFCGGSLRRLDQTRTLSESFPPALGMRPRDFFQFFPRIQTVNLPVGIAFGPYCWSCDATSHPPETLQSNAYLVLQIQIISEPCRCDLHSVTAQPPPFPSLTTAIVSGDILRFGTSTTSRFIRLQGPLLTTVYLTGSISPLEPQYPSFASSLQTLGQHCPRLSRLVLALQNMLDGLGEPTVLNERRLDIIRSIPTTVTHLGPWYGHYPLYARTDLRRIICWLATPEIRRTSIRVVRMFDQKTPQGHATMLPPFSAGTTESEGIRLASDDLDQELLEDSPEDLFAQENGVPPHRFVGALRRLSEYGIRVEHADGREVTELDH